MHCVITGAADGIGRALAHRFAQADYHITGLDVDAIKAKRTQLEIEKMGGNITFIQADLSQAEGVLHAQNTLCQGQDIDILIHNAGISAFGAFSSLDINQQNKVIEINLLAPIQVTTSLFKQNKILSQGALVFVSSLSHYVGYPGASVYAASKDGLAAYARSLAVAMTGQNIHVMTVYPGPTRTEHARRYSPDNSRETKRMPPSVLAEQVYQGVVKRKRTLIPGGGNKAFAFIGRLWPDLTGMMLKKTLFDKAIQTTDQ